MMLQSTDQLPRLKTRKLSENIFNQVMQLMEPFDAVHEVLVHITSHSFNPLHAG